MRQVALVTGASRGIGSAIAAQLAREGYSVCINYHQNRQAAQALADRLQSQGYSAMTAAADVAVRAEVEAMVRSVGAVLCRQRHRRPKRHFGGAAPYAL